MSELKLISTQTVLNVVGSVITIRTFYIDPLAGVSLAFISEVIGGETVDTIAFIEGEGGISVSGASPPTFSLNSNGELIVTATDSANYNVDTSTGQLQYIN